MSRVTLRVTMELLSDTILGSGHSTPGGEDIAVYRDDNGYPYLKGTALKGLLRENLENWLDWTGGSQADVNAILGESGWCGQTDERRMLLTDLKLTQFPSDPELCYDMRTFTQLENGVIKSGTLRSAMCICRGLTFTGELICEEADAELIQNALSCIKWAGTMRSRGFGCVKVKGERLKPSSDEPERLPAANCIRLRLRIETPVLITDLGRSQNNSYETRGFIPGSAVRGLVISSLQEQKPEWFQSHRAELLSERVRFLDLVPVLDEQAPLPSIMGFYENKEGTRFVSVVPDGTFDKGLKRAKLGEFCSLADGTVHFWSAKTDGVTRIQRSVQAGEDSRPFQTSYLKAGQELEGYILLEDGSMAPELGEVFAGPVWIGADRYEGFGKCSVSRLKPAAEPKWMTEYGCGSPEDVPCAGEGQYVLYLLAVSPLTMLDEYGEPCGIDEKYLAKKLGVDSITMSYCSTAVSEYGSYNRTWQCREPSMRMYDRGSIFKLLCSQKPECGRLRAVQREGLGIRKAEGYGQILFLRPELFEGLHKKEKLEPDHCSLEKAEQRRARIRWIMDNAGRVYANRLSKSQLGSIQSLCEKAKSKGGNLWELNQFFRKNINRGTQGQRFESIHRMVEKILDTPLSETLGVPYENADDTVCERLSLLIQLFDFSRKDIEKGGA